MAFTQKTFLGASIRGWTSSIGYGTTESSMTVELVEDSKNGDIFTPQDPGTPVYFAYENFIFGGLIQNIKTTGNSGGSPLYSVTIVDPRSILEGVQIILSNYNGTTHGVHNIYNVFGYLENQGGFGSANVNEAGIPYNKISQGLLGIYNSPGTTYGKYISYRGYQYLVDLSNLPNVPSDYRIGGDSISLMDFIKEICTIGGSEDSFFFKLEANIIKLYVNDRSRNPVTGAITRFIINTPGAVSKEIGLEMRNQTTSKFLVGGDVEQIYLQVYNDDYVEPYWGVDKDNNAIIGRINEQDEYEFTVDSRRINIPGIGSTYTMDIPELRAALDSRESWEAFIVNQENVEGPHFGKASRLGIHGNTNEMIGFLNSITGSATDVETIKQKIKNVSPLEFNNFLRKTLEKGDNLSPSDRHYVDEYIGILYNFVNDYATNYYGRQFMVKIPYIYTYTDNETGNVSLSQVPTDSGYIDEQYVERAIELNILPQDSDALTNAENKTICFVRFDNAQDLDLREISPDNIVFNRTTIGRGNKRNSFGLSVFIHANVDSKIVYQNYSTKFSPRVIVSLPGTVRNYIGDESNRYNGVFEDILTKFLQQKNIESSFDEIAQSYSSKFGADSLFFGNKGIAMSPNVFGIPLVSKVQTYGPWYASGGDGKTEFQKDTSLVPWNYGGFRLMNLAGESAVNQAISSQFVSEAGSIEFPDVPNASLGDILIFGGPYITDINTSIGNDGCKTTYRMQAWTPRFGRLPQSMVDRIQRMTLGQQRLKKEILARNRPSPVDIGRVQRFFRDEQVNRKSHNSSHGVIVGEITKDDDRSIVSVFLQPAYNSIPQVANNYINKGIASLDSLFVPFSTDYEYEGNLPHFERPSGDAPNLDDLDPFRGTHGSTIMSHGDELPENLSLRGGGYNSDDNYRALALRAPVILAGWGYTSSGNLTHSETDIRVKTELWKVGPLDTRWDDTKKVWLAGSSSGSQLLRCTNLGNGTAKLDANYSGIASSGAVITIGEWLGGPMCSGQKILVTKEDSNYYVVNIQYSALDVVTNITCEDDITTVCKRTIYLPSAYSNITCEGVS